MNVKKRLQKILDYVNDLEAENTFLDSKVAELEKPIFQAVNGYGKLIQFIDLERENARLREQLRWRDAKKEPPKRSGYYFTKQLGGIIDITYYNYTSTYGWECDNNVLKWMPIPEGGDA